MFFGWEIWKTQKFPVIIWEAESEWFSDDRIGVGLLDWIGQKWNGWMWYNTGLKTTLQSVDRNQSESKEKQLQIFVANTNFNWCLMSPPEQKYS